MSKTKRNLLSLCSLSLLIVAILAGAAVSTESGKVNGEMVSNETSNTQKTVVIDIPSDKILVPLAITTGNEDVPENTEIVYKKSSVTINCEEDLSVEIGEGELLESGGVSLHD